MYYKSRSYQLFYVVNIVLLILISVLCILPMVHVLSVSLSGKAPAMANLVKLLPIEFTVDAYLKTFGNDHFISAMTNSILRAAAGTALGMFITVLTAYPLSKSGGAFRGRNAIAWFFVFTMLFQAGLVPNYIAIQKLGLMNSFWVLIIPFLVSAWNIILMLNFFRGLPKEIEESALIDGSSYFRMLFAIYIPLSMPAIATLSLFTLVWHWNSWFEGLIYLSSPDRWPMSTLLQSIIVQLDFSKIAASGRDLENISSRTVKAAQIFIGALPILIIYPFLQRFFVKGMVLGAVKE